MSEIHCFTLLDRAGKSHAYETTLHPAPAGLRVLGAFVQFGLGGATGRLDLSKLLPLAEVVRDILGHTRRANDGGELLDLAADGAFDGAYRGNYGELVRAVSEVVRANDFLPLPAGITTELKRLLGAVMAKATPASSPSPGAPPSSE